jgi:myo-inositol-1(or 4)-monophosphatase
MAESDRVRRLRLLREASRAGGALALDSFREELRVETKSGPMDAVTEVDRAVQRRVATRIRDSYPDEPIVGEENAADASAEVPETGPAWVVDPIDGTNNYVVGNRRWATSVAAVRDGRPVASANYLPALSDTYVAGESATRNGDPIRVSEKSDPSSFTVATIFGLSAAERRELVQISETITTAFGDLRRLGSGQATLSMVASGELDAAVSTVRLPPWDTLAGVHLVRRAGGTVTDAAGDPWRHDSVGLVASNGEAHDALVDAVGEN